MPDTETMPDKGPGGRPSKYKPEHCEAIMLAGGEGKTVPEMADDLDVHIDTLYEWAKVHPEFSEAFSRAKEKAEAWWARKLRLGLQMKPADFQGQPFLKYMAQRFPGWSEKAHVKTSDGSKDDDVETPDYRKAARKVAFMLNKAIQDAN